MRDTRENIQNGLAYAVAWISGAVVMALIVMTMCKIGGALFDASNDPSLSERSVTVCEKKGGTPVLEGTGTAYKACAINGKSETKNVVN